MTGYTLSRPNWGQNNYTVENSDTIMFIPIRKNLSRWGTPDPESDWMMFGHVLVGDEGCTLFDPPLVPGLLDALNRLGKVQSVVLTTLDHFRGAAHIVKKTGANLYLPDQEATDVNPYAFNMQKEIHNFQKYGEGEILALNAFRLKVKENHEIGMPSMNEFAILTDHKELIVGDFVSGSADGRVLVAPEWFTAANPSAQYKDARIEFRKLVEKTGARTLLTSHGYYIMGNLKEAAQKL